MVLAVDAEPAAMRRNLALRNMLSYSFGANCAQFQSESFRFAHWSSTQVANWIRGIDDSTSSIANNFAEHHVDGSKLLNFDDFSLRKIGIRKGAVRKKILNAIELLCYFAYTLKQDNLQRAAMNVNVSTTNMINAIFTATAVINNPLQSSRVFDVLSAVLCAVTDVYTNVRRLMCWLDRSPFRDKAEFISLREKISAFIKEMIDCVNNPNNPKFFSVPQLLVERGKRVQEFCTKIVRMNDPSILYTTYFERVTIRKNAPSRWGFEVSNMFNGMGMITSINLETPAGISGKVEAGDEIIEINGEPVIGWSRTSLMRLINNKAFLPLEIATHGSELTLLLNKRPREIWAAVTNSGVSIPPATPSAPLRITALFQQQDDSGISCSERMKMMLDFKMKIQPDYLARHQESNPLLSARARSFSFNFSTMFTQESFDRCTISPGRCASLFVSNNNRKQPTSRRASVWGESPPAMLRSPLDGPHYQMESNAWLLLLASWGGRQKSGAGFFGRGGGPLTPRLKELNDSIKEEDGEYSSSDEFKKPLIASDLEFSHIETINDNEFNRLKVHFRLQAPSIYDNDWNRSIREITGLKMAVKRTHLESGSNNFIIDSPLSTIQAKITRFFYGDSSPSHSVASGGTHSATASVALPESISTSVSSEKLVVDGANCRTPLAGRLEHYLFGGSSSSSVNSPLPTTPGVEKFTLPKRTPALQIATPQSASTSAGSNFRNSAEKPVGFSPPQIFIPQSNSQEQLSAVTSISSASTPFIHAPPDVTLTTSANESKSFSFPSLNLPIKTVAKNARGGKLAPLAEPDEVGELTATSMEDPPTEIKTTDLCYMQGAAFIPCQKLKAKTFEGAARRQKLLHLDGRSTFLRGSQWTKCWMVLKDEILYVYENEYAEEADVVINVSYFYLTTSTDLRTSKKHVFTLCWSLESISFALASNEELEYWLYYLQPIARTNADLNFPSSSDIEHTDEEKANAFFVRSTAPLSGDDGGGTASTGPTTPSPLFIKTSMAPISPVSMASSHSSSSAIITTPSHSPRAFTFLPTKFFSKANRHSSLRSPNAVVLKPQTTNSNIINPKITSSYSSTGIAQITTSPSKIAPKANDLPSTTSNTKMSSAPVYISISSSSPPLSTAASTSASTSATTVGDRQSNSKEDKNVK